MTLHADGVPLAGDRTGAVADRAADPVDLGGMARAADLGINLSSVNSCCANR